MALAEGTNCGFVTVAPVADPDGADWSTIDAFSRVSKFTSPATAIKIIEMGWYDRTAGTEEADYQLGLYAADGAVVPQEAGTLLQSSTAAKGTSAGWHRITGLDWTISGSTVYWLGVACKNTLTVTQIDGATSGFSGRDSTGFDALPNPFNGGVFAANAADAIYAVWEAAPEPSVSPPYPLSASSAGMGRKDSEGRRIHIEPHRRIL